MPRLSNSLPKYRKHKASGQSFVELNGRRFYLGPHGTKASKNEYDRLIGEWLANGRSIPVSTDNVLTIIQLAARPCSPARTKRPQMAATTATKSASRMKGRSLLLEHTKYISVLNGIGGMYTVAMTW